MPIDKYLEFLSKKIIEAQEAGNKPEMIRLMESGIETLKGIIEELSN